MFTSKLHIRPALAGIATLRASVLHAVRTLETNGILVDPPFLQTLGADPEIAALFHTVLDAVDRIHGRILVLGYDAGQVMAVTPRLSDADHIAG